MCRTWISSFIASIYCIVEIGDCSHELNMLKVQYTENTLGNFTILCRKNINNYIRKIIDYINIESSEYRPLLYMGFLLFLLVF